MIKELGLKILGLAVILRILVSVLLFHPDIKTINFQVSFLKQGVINIYPFLIENRSRLPLKEEFVYFPLTYFSLGSYHTVVSSILGESFNNWIKNADSNAIVGSSNIFIYLFALKSPLLLADLLIAYLIFEYFKNNKKDGTDAVNLWLFNPVTIFLIYAYSNIDIYVVLLSLLSMLLLKNNKLVLSSIVLGLAISFKLYPLLFLPFFFVSIKDLKNKIVFIGVSVGTFLLTIIPFFSKAFINSALLSGLSTRIFTPNFEIGSGESMLMSIVLISALFFFELISKNKNNIVGLLAVILLIIFSFAHFHISWLLWVIPFLVILSQNDTKIKILSVIWILIAVSIPLLYADRSMTISLFRIYSTWFDLIPTPFSLIQKVYDPFSLMSILHSALLGVSMPLSYLILKKEEND